MAQPASATLTLNTNACLAPNPVMIAGVGRDVIRPDCIPPTTFSPQVRWSWTGSSIEPTFRNVWMTPLVANLTDDNADGRVDENDVPEVIFTTFDDVPISDPTVSRPGVLRVVSGDSNVGNSWVAAPRIWNQQAYHVINVTESGAIPRIRTPIPQAPKVFRGTIADCEPEAQRPLLGDRSHLQARAIAVVQAHRAHARRCTLVASSPAPASAVGVRRSPRRMTISRTYSSPLPGLGQQRSVAPPASRSRRV